MFTDNTTLYLSKDDRFNDVEEILRRWCEVSRAKFNIEKTEIIPIGPHEHRTDVIASRKINPKDQCQLAIQIKIAKEEDGICLLGAWIGNNIDDMSPWEPIIDLIKKDLNQWLRIHPTL